MLNNKWIISDKYQITPRPEYLYTLVLVDCDARLYKTECQHICSSKDLNIGGFVDCDLNPLSIHYNQTHADIATVEFINTYNVGDSSLKKISFFSDCIGCFDALVVCGDNEISVKRGHEISVFMRKDPSNPLNIDKSPDYFVFKMMKNLNTGEKSPHFEYIIDNYNGVFENVLITGIDSAGTNEEPAKKHMLLKSPKFGYASLLISSEDTLFFTQKKDKLLIEHNPNNNTFEILQNITVDNIRTEYVLNQR